MCITAHFVNGHRRMVNRLIGFRVIEGDHSGTHLAETFFEVLEEFGVTNKVSWLEKFAFCCWDSHVLAV
jgi:hypothetical protein